ncbi:MAG: hypothetical protein WC447_00735 [Candidatus Paceibacterota bacterium]|jgi:hypothetical protein
MTKVKIIFGLGVWVAVLPYLGFPYSFKNILFSISGLAIICFGYMLYRDFKAGETEEKTFDNFSENNNFNEIEINLEEQVKLNKK